MFKGHQHKHKKFIFNLIIYEVGCYPIKCNNIPLRYFLSERNSSIAQLSSAKHHTLSYKPKNGEVGGGIEGVMQR
jgi:hypothetical protein